VYGGHVYAYALSSAICARKNESNENSLVVMLQYEGVRALFMGDRSSTSSEARRFGR
jgi:beta-lactamase superfamily II metal-dependent hydrolase